MDGKVTTGPDEEGLWNGRPKNVEGKMHGKYEREEKSKKGHRGKGVTKSRGCDEGRESRSEMGAQKEVIELEARKGNYELKSILEPDVIIEVVL